VLPGVGAFGNGMENLRDFGLIPVLEEEVLEKRKPFWGICLGMQLLARSSEEFGEHEGLGWVPADVKKFAFPQRSGLRIPHVGWNDVTFVREHPVAGAGKPTDFYFVHSYYMTSEDPQLPLGTCDYGGPFVACIARGNIIATQFHPEKSQRDGLNMLQRFCAWQPSPQS